MRLKQITRNLILSEHNQRRVLAAELHDYLGPRLTLCGFKVNQFKMLLHDESASEKVTEILDILEEALTYTRTLISDLHPAVLKDWGLFAGLEWLAEKMKAHDLDVKLLIPKRHMDFREEISILIFESIRELLVNVRKHAHVHSAMVSVKLTKAGLLKILVSDKGSWTKTRDYVT